MTDARPIASEPYLQKFASAHIEMRSKRRSPLSISNTCKTRSSAPFSTSAFKKDLSAAMLPIAHKAWRQQRCEDRSCTGSKTQTCSFRSTLLRVVKLISSGRAPFSITTRVSSQEPAETFVNAQAASNCTDHLSHHLFPKHSPSLVSFRSHLPSELPQSKARVPC